MPAKPTSTSEYLAMLPKDKRAALKQIRKTILSVAPKAEDAFSYGIPGFTLNGQRFIWYAAWKNHYSLYPVSAAMLREHGAAISEYETSKGTIRFPNSAPLPLGLVKKLMKTRAAEVRANAK